MGGHIDTDEVRLALSGFRAGRLLAWRPLLRGSPSSPKALIRTDTGVFVLKRRESDPYRVAFSHAVVQHVTRRGVPAPELIGTKFQNNTMLQLAGTGAPGSPTRIYELMRFVYGHRTDRSVEATASAGRTQALYHAALAGFSTAWDPPLHLEPSPEDVARHLSNDACGGDKVRERLINRYAVSHRARAFLGVDAGPAQICHGDWHRGNLLFHARSVVAVLDHDLCRKSPTLPDLACGAFQFSQGLRKSGPGPNSVDLGLLGVYLRAYEATLGHPLTSPELRAMPHLMIARLILEVLGASPSGPTEIMQAVDRTTAWLEASAEDLARVLG